MDAGGAAGPGAGRSADGARRSDFPDRRITFPPFVLSLSKHRFSFSSREGRPPSTCSGSGYLTGLAMTETLPTSALDPVPATLSPDGCTPTAYIHDGWIQGPPSHCGTNPDGSARAAKGL